MFCCHLLLLITSSSHSTEQHAAISQQNELQREGLATLLGLSGILENLLLLLII